jgi:glucose/arabinose dehydrogenase
MPLPLRLLALAALMAATPLAAADDAETLLSELHDVRVVTITEGLEHPWGLAFLPDGRMLVTERPGTLRIIGADGSLEREPVAGLPDAVDAHGQGGLLDVALHPDYAQNGWIYLSYAAEGRGGHGTEVARGRLKGNSLRDVEVLFSMQPKSGNRRHFGSRLIFDRDGYLYVTLGDRGEEERAQRLDDHAGSVLRLHDDGRVPEDNPFLETRGALPEIYTYGNRNVQGGALNPYTGEVWTHEHGPQGGDEINIIRAGTNYGWPTITYGVQYVTGAKIGEGTAKPGMAQPLHYWVPSIAPSGMSFYDGALFPKWQGQLFVGGLREQALVRLELDGERVVKEERMFTGELGRIRDVRQGPDGALYLLSDARKGKLMRLEPAD